MIVRALARLVKKGSYPRIGRWTRNGSTRDVWTSNGRAPVVLSEEVLSPLFESGAVDLFHSFSYLFSL